MRVLIVLTSAGMTGDGKAKTGFSFAAFASVYYALVDAGVELALASPQGGTPPYDPAPARENPAERRFRADRAARGVLTDTLRLDQIEPDDFDAAIYPGGPGTHLDLAVDPHSHAILGQFAREGKPVGVIGDGIAALFGGPIAVAQDATDAADIAHRIVSLISPRTYAP